MSGWWLKLFYTDFIGKIGTLKYVISRVILRIPKQVATEILERNWSILGYSPLFVQCALYLGTPNCLKLAKLSIDECPSSIDILKHIHSQFGIHEYERDRYLTKQHIYNLQPYIGRLGEAERWSITEAAQKLGMSDWCKQYIYPFMSERQKKQYFPTEANSNEELDRIVNHDKFVMFSMQHWVEGFEKRRGSKDNVIESLDKWLSLNRNMKCFSLVAHGVQVLGLRKYLYLLSLLHNPPP
ncbi:MAG: hypothetical protein ABSH12_09935 [Endomicrobiales bacterium]